MKLGFATDIHLDADGFRLLTGYPDQRAAGERLAADHDALVVTGDISTGEHFEAHFRAFCEGAKIPVYFVLGNHDFYDAPESVVRATAAAFPGYLDGSHIIELSPRVALVGRTGWYDTLSGCPSTFRAQGDSIKDWKRIERLVDCWRIPQLLERTCIKWSEEETEKAVPLLEAAARGYQEVFFATHFPCFTAACFAPDGGWWPWSINTTMGVALRKVVDRFPNTDFTFLSGHTHRGGRKQLGPNLLCVAGQATYGYPRLAESWML